MNDILLYERRKWILLLLLEFGGVRHSPRCRRPQSILIAKMTNHHGRLGTEFFGVISWQWSLHGLDHVKEGPDWMVKVWQKEYRHLLR